MSRARNLFTPAPLAVGLLLLLGACSTPGPPAPSPQAAGSLGPAATAGAASPTSSASAAPSASEPATQTPTSASSDVTGSAEALPSTSTSRASVVPQTVPLPTVSVVGPTMPESKPVSMTIPAIGAQSDLLDLGLNPDQTAQVPPLDEPISQAGWLDSSPTPGEVGPAILLGHVDSKQYGPGIFYNLGNLVPGDTVEVTRADGTVAIFQIDGVRSYLKSEFPTAEVYGNLDHAGLRLITCGGAFDAAASSYTSNIIAFASLVEVR